MMHAGCVECAARNVDAVVSRLLTWHVSGMAPIVLQPARLVRPYTGSGVVTGFCDTGFDPNHIAFLDADGNSRVRLLVAYDEPNGERTVVDTPEGIASWTTDNVDEFHGTHVANIMAGGFRDGLYYGLAPDADIVATTSQLYDAGLLSACEDIVDYAKSVGKPAVINLSVGSYNGPHDGSSLFCRYMDMLAEDAIVCLSAGNEGQRNNTFRAAFTEDFRIWRTRTMSGNWMQFDMNGMIDAWSHDTRPVGISFLIRDNVDSSVYYRHRCSRASPSSPRPSTYRPYRRSEVLLKAKCISPVMSATSMAVG